MSPRTYQLGKRQDQIDEGRQRVINAARSQLAEVDRYRSFTVEAVARQADVAKATIYYQFGSKTGLLEALCDDLAHAGGMADMSAAFTDPDPRQGLRTLAGVFARFWEQDRDVMRRLRGLAVLDTEVGIVIAAREQRRRSALEVLVGRLAEGRQSSQPPDRERLVRTLCMLTSFETFDALAGPARTLIAVVGDVIRLVEDAVRAEEEEGEQEEGDAP